MALVGDWLPPSRENWELIVTLFTYFPVVAALQWVIPWYPMGKTSTTSRLNIPGKIAWITMESPGFLTLIYIMFTLPTKLAIEELPWENWALASLFVFHYLYRAVLSTFISPSISPIHPLIWLMAFAFQLFNAVSIGGYLGGYGPTTQSGWYSGTSEGETRGRIFIGLLLWAFGFSLSVWHDEELRELRRAAIRKQRASNENSKTVENGKGANKIYIIPENGMFRFIFYPHYLFEWVEWTGFWVMAGTGCVPARNFVFNEISTMLPRAVQGKRWYLGRFGKEKVRGRKAIIPGLL